MKKGLFIASLAFGLSVAATAQTGTFYAVLTGAGENPAADPDGIGFGVVTLDAAAGTATFDLIGINIANPTAAHIHRGQPGQNGPVIIPFNSPFNNGAATGVTTGVATTLINEILTNNPQNYYINIHNADFPGGAIRGPLIAAPSTSAPVVLFEPVVAKVPGARGETFASDIRLVNRSASAGTATLDFFASNSAGLAAPTATRNVPVPANSEVSINDVLGSTFSSSGIGALRITADRDIIAVSRLTNDKRSTNGGTAGTLIPTQRLSDTCRAGTLPLLSQASSTDQSNGLGFRTAIGYFTPSSLPVTATFTVRRADGTAVGSKTVTIPGFSHAQFALFDLVDTVASSDRVQDDFFVTFTMSGGPAFVYSAVVDNRTGDNYVQSAICSQ